MADANPVENSDLAEMIVRVLTEHGPMAEPELITVLRDRGADLGTDPGVVEDALDADGGPAIRVADGRWVWLPSLLGGRVFTHRLTAAEIQHDVLDTNPDLEPLSMLLANEDYQHLIDGSPIVEVLLPFDADRVTERSIPLELISEHGGLLVEPGYLSALGAGAGDLIGLRVTPDGLRLEAVPEPVITREALTTWGQQLGAVLADDPSRPVELDIAIWTACADDPTLFTEPLPPIGQLLDDCGLARDGDWLAVGGFDFGRWRAGNACTAIAYRHGLSDDEALAVLAIATMYHQVAALRAAASAAYQSGDDDALADIAAEIVDTTHAPATNGAQEPGNRATVRVAVALLAEPAVAEAVLDETMGSDDEGAAALRVFAETLEPLAPREARPAVRWLRAKAFERLGDVIQAEATYLAAESLDPSWPPTLVDLARYASDRGDAARGLALLRRVGTPPDDVLLEILEHFQPTPRPGLGRNEPCWCGSGRKYKKCHLHHEQLPPDERAAWLYQKAGMFLADGPWREELIDVARERAAYTDSPLALIDAVGDPLVNDAVLFEGGAFDEFLAIRGALLPDDERLLAEQWLLIDRSVFEVQQVRPGEGLTLRDLRTGDVHHVRERTASRQITAGTLLCTRIVPAGDTMQSFGGMEPVQLHQRDQLIALLDSEPGPVELVAFLTRRFAPPVLANTEGDPLVLCEATLRTNDPASLSAALDDTYDRTEHQPDTPTWLEHVTTHGMERIRTFLNLDGAQLHIHTNSEPRFHRVLNTLRALDPSITVVKQHRQPVRDTREAAELAARTPHSGVHQLDHSDPQVAAALDQFTRDYEQKWLDDPIPALAGLTPRQAADEPTRRDDLIRLLDTFPHPEGNPGMMDPDRLRAALDLR